MLSVRVSLKGKRTSLNAFGAGVATGPIAPPFRGAGPVRRGSVSLAETSPAPGGSVSAFLPFSRLPHRILSRTCPCGQPLPDRACRLVLVGSFRSTRGLRLRAFPSLLQQAVALGLAGCVPLARIFGFPARPESRCGSVFRCCCGHRCRILSLVFPLFLRVLALKLLVSSALSTLVRLRPLPESRKVAQANLSTGRHLGGG